MQGRVGAREKLQVDLAQRTEREREGMVGRCGEGVKSRD